MKDSPKNKQFLVYTPTLDLTITRHYLNNTPFPVSYQDFPMYILVFRACVAHERLRGLVQSLFVQAK